MSEATIVHVTPKFSEKKLAKIMAAPKRWRILKELAKGEPLPANVLGRLAGTTPNLASKHLAILRDAGLVVVGYGRLYRLHPALPLDLVARTLDLGYFFLKLDAPG